MTSHENKEFILFIYLFIHLFVYLFIHLFIYLRIYLFIYLSLHLNEAALHFIDFKLFKFWLASDKQ